MNKKQYIKIEEYMKFCCGESVHDEEHIYRVLYNAIDIANTVENVNMDVVIASCLLHDVARIDELKDKNIDHAIYGSEKAYKWLCDNGFDKDFANSVSQCIKEHRYRGENIPSTVEAKILFDADKIDVAGFMRIARTLMYKGLKSQPLYIKENGVIDNGSFNRSSFFGEYVFKLSKVYSRLFTKRAKEITLKMKKDAQYFYDTLLNELEDSYKNGQKSLDELID